jgi:D-alanyl-lipoteichoic acid acyltransferase DltB (MBOAT superfamily)
MLFNSIDFVVFLPIVFALYWFAFQRNLRIQNFFLVAASYIFYGWWDWRFLILMTVTILCSYASGILIDRARREADQTAARRRARAIVAANIAVNLLILGFFKYYNFFAQSFVEAFTLLGKPLEAHTLKIILPVGISFYTFQALSYSIDVYRRKLEPTKDVIAFFAFVSFFPQLVAGPIERATNLLTQFYHLQTHICPRLGRHRFYLQNLHQIRLFRQILLYRRGIRARNQ